MANIYSSTLPANALSPVGEDVLSALRAGRLGGKAIPSLDATSFDNSLADTAAREIVRATLSLMLSHPEAPLLDVLDLAMQGKRDSSPSFDTQGVAVGFDDWTDPTSPFGEVLRRAFGPDEVGPGAAELWESKDPADAAALTQLDDDWQEFVVERFAVRYGLWC